MSYKTLRKRQNECEDSDNYKIIVEDTFMELKYAEEQLKLYKDIEKKLGMPLDKFSLLINKKVKRVYYEPHKMTHKIFLEKHDLVDLVLHKSITMRGLGCGLIIVPLKDYGKTWAFTEEEFKNKC